MCVVVTFRFTECVPKRFSNVTPATFAYIYIYLSYIQHIHVCVQTVRESQWKPRIHSELKQLTELRLCVAFVCTLHNIAASRIPSVLLFVFFPFYCWSCSDAKQWDKHIVLLVGQVLVFGKCAEIGFRWSYKQWCRLDGKKSVPFSAHKFSYELWLGSIQWNPAFLETLFHHFYSCSQSKIEANNNDLEYFIPNMAKQNGYNIQLIIILVGCVRSKRSTYEAFYVIL